MKRNYLERVVFYSKTDGAVVHNLERVEKLLNTIDLNSDLDIADLLELYDVKLYLDNDLYLLSWNEATKINYKALVDQAWLLIKKFWLGINDFNILSCISYLEYNYNETYWRLINYFQVYKKISKPVFISILDKFPFQITYIMANKNIVQHFDIEISSFLMNYKTAAELLLSRIEEKQSSDRTEYHFPTCLTLNDRETIMDKYLDNPDANLNYVRLIEKSKDSAQLKLSAKLKLKAKRKAVQLNSQIMEDGYTWREGVQVVLDKDQEDLVNYSRNEGILEVSYSEEYLNSKTTETSLFQVFRKLFAYLDNTGLITLVSKPSELDVMEIIQMQSKNEYVTGTVFLRKSMLSQLQLLIYNDYLKRRNINLEETIEAVVTQYFRKAFDIDLKLKFPSGSATYLEKIRTLSPEFEFLLRQYQAFVNDGEIDLELLQINSLPLFYSDIRSTVQKKYVYSEHEKIRYLKFIFFSDQSPLHYVKPFNSKYSRLYDLLVSEDVDIDNFANYQRPQIDQLIADDYLMLNNNNCVKLKKKLMLFLIGEMHSANVISYWHYPELIRQTIDDMAKDGLVTFDNKLFTKEELNYFNFYLNKKEYTNGYDLRNKYLHGTNTASENEHHSEYYMLLKIVILAVLKIEDDLILNKTALISKSEF